MSGANNNDLRSGVKRLIYDSAASDPQTVPTTKRYSDVIEDRVSERLNLWYEYTNGSLTRTEITLEVDDQDGGTFFAEASTVDASTSGRGEVFPRIFELTSNSPTKGWIRHSISAGRMRFGVLGVGTATGSSLKLYEWRASI